MRKTLAFVFSLGVIASVEADSGRWDNLLGAPWDQTVPMINWTPGPSFPNAIDEVAVFDAGHPLASAIITSGSNITIGQLILRTGLLEDVTFDFGGGNTLTFDSLAFPSIDFQINNEQHHKISSTDIINTNFLTPLQINVNGNSFLTLDDLNLTGFFQKHGTGTLLFTGSGNKFVAFGTQFEGFTQIGTTSTDSLQTKSAVTIDTAGTLDGFGTFNVQGGIDNFGTVIPGGPNVNDSNQVGVLTLSQSSVIGYTQESSGQFVIKAFSPATADKLVITDGDVMLDGKLTLQAANGVFNPGDSFIIIDNSGPGGTGISGTFSSFEQHLPPNLQATIIYNPFDVTILFAAVPPTPPVPPVPPSPSLKNYIDLSQLQFSQLTSRQINLVRRMARVRGRASSSEKSQTSTALQPIQLDREILLASAHPLQSFSTQMNALDQKNQEMAARADDTPKGKQQVQTSRFRKTPTNEPLSIYASALGSLGDVDGNKKQRGYDFNSVGGLLGVDYAFSRVGIGIQGGYETVDGDVRKHWGNFDVQSAFGSAYMTILPFHNRNFFLDLTGSGVFDWYEIHRKTHGKTAKGSPDGWEWDVYGGIGYDFLNQSQSLRFTPLAAFEYISMHIDGYKEHGAGRFDTKVSGQNIHSERTWLGASLGGKWVQNSITWMPEIRGYWQHEFAKQNRRLHVSSIAFNTTSNVQILSNDRNYGWIGAELLVLLGKHCSLTAAYDYNWSGHLQNNLLYGELAVNF